VLILVDAYETNWVSAALTDVGVVAKP